MAIFSTNVGVENQVCLTENCICGALNRHFVKTTITFQLLWCVSFLTFYLLAIVHLFRQKSQHKTENEYRTNNRENPNPYRLC